MLLAIPYCKPSISNHFTKAPQVLLWDSQTKARRLLDIPESLVCGERKQYWSQLLLNNNVDAVVVRLIGTNMLNTFFKLSFPVLSAPRGFELEEIDMTLLTSVTDIGFAHPSGKKKLTCCSGKGGHCSVGSSRRVRPNNGILLSKQDPSHKLAPKAVHQFTNISQLKIS